VLADMNNPPQVSPVYRYHGGYVSLVECSSCKAIGQYWDFHPVNPCRFCGEKVKEIGSGIWRRKVVGKKFFGLFNKYEGYWEKK
jgi:hypothetical protein